MDVMSFLNSYTYRFWQWAVEFLLVLFLVGGFAVLATGLSLIFNSAGALRFFAAMNRWVSTRRAFKPIEVPRDTREAAQKYRHWLAVFFVAGGAFAFYGLVARFDAAAVIYALGPNFLRSPLASWLVDSVRWVLIAGNLVAIVTGILLAFFPGAMTALEARGGHWYSARQWAKDRDRMYLVLDNWVAEFPRASGCIITFFALVLIGTYGLMLPAIR